MHACKYTCTTMHIHTQMHEPRPPICLHTYIRDTHTHKTSQMHRVDPPCTGPRVEGRPRCPVRAPQQGLHAQAGGVVCPPSTVVCPACPAQGDPFFPLQLGPHLPTLSWFQLQFGHHCPRRMDPFKLLAPCALAAHSCLPLSTEA